MRVEVGVTDSAVDRQLSVVLPLIVHCEVALVVEERRAVSALYIQCALRRGLSFVYILYVPFHERACVEGAAAFTALIFSLQVHAVYIALVAYKLLPLEEAFLTLRALKWLEAYVHALHMIAHDILPVGGIPAMIALVAQLILMTGLIMSPQIMCRFVSFVAPLTLVRALSLVLLAHMLTQVFLQVEFALAAIAP